MAEQPKKPVEPKRPDASTPLRLPEVTPEITPERVPLNAKVSPGHMAAKR